MIKKKNNKASAISLSITSNIENLLRNQAVNLKKLEWNISTLQAHNFYQITFMGKIFAIL